MQNIAMFFLVAVAMGGLAWVFIYPIAFGRKARRETQGIGRPRHGAATRARARNAAEVTPRAD